MFLPGVPTMNRIRLWFLLAFTILAFSSIEVVANPIRHRIDPLALTFWRFLLGGLCLLPILVRSLGSSRESGREPGRESGHEQRLPRTLNDLLWLGGLGFLNVVISMGAHAVSFTHARASTAAIIIASNPLATTLFARLILGEALGPRRLLSLLIGVFGVGLVAWKPLPGEDSLLGIVAGLVGMTTFGLYTVLSKSAVKRFGSPMVALVGFLLGALADLPVLWMLGVPLFPEPELWLPLLFLGIVVSGLGYVAFFELLAVLPAGKTSLLFFVKPPVAIFLAWVFLGEHPSAWAVVGAVLVMSGILLSLSESPEARSERSPTPARGALSEKS